MSCSIRNLQEDAMDYDNNNEQARKLLMREKDACRMEGAGRGRGRRAQKGRATERGNCGREE